MDRALLAAVIVTGLACERADDRSSHGQAPSGATVTVPPPLPGEPAIGADRERMLQLFATNISQGLYTPSNLLFLLCNTEAGLAVARQAGDPLSMALMRRMVALFRQGPGMASATCPNPPPQTP